MSGLDGFFSGVEHKTINGARDLGELADDAGQLGGKALDAVGWHSAANDLRSAGQWTADRLGATVPEAELGESDDPKELIHGDPAAIRTAAGHLRRFGTAFHEVAKGMRSVDTGHWQGEAADTFHAKFTPHPAKWSTAGDSFEEAASALGGYAHTVTWAQGQASEAIRLYQRAVHATDQADAAYDHALQQYESTGHGAPPKKPTLTDDDFGDAITANSTLDDAREQRDREAEHAERAVRNAYAHAPKTPTFSLKRALEDEVAYNAVSGEHFLGGLGKGAGDLLKFVRGVDPQDPYNLTHPDFYLDHITTTAAGLVHAGNHPGALIKSVVGTDWGNDPSQAAGALAANLASGALTDGGSAADSLTADATENGVKSVADDTAVEPPIPPVTAVTEDAFYGGMHPNALSPAIAKSFVSEHFPFLEDLNAPRMNAKMPGYDTNCTNNVVAVDKNLDGVEVYPAPKIGGGDVNQAALGAEHVPRQTMRSYDDIIRDMRARGAGSRGVVFLDRPGGMGHVFNVVTTEQGVAFVDGQIGTLAHLEHGVGAIHYLPYR